MADLVRCDNCQTVGPPELGWVYLSSPRVRGGRITSPADRTDLCSYGCLQEFANARDDRELSAARARIPNPIGG